MTNTVILDHDAILRHAHMVAEAARANSQPVMLDCIKLLVCVIFILGAAIAEYVSATVAIGAAYPRLSDGSSLADAISPLRFSIPFYAVLGHVVISSFTGRFALGVKGLLALLGLTGILMMMLAMGLFSFAGTFQTVGGGDEQTGWLGALAATAGPALGAVCGVLFTVAFIAAHILAGKLLAKAGVIFAEINQRAKLSVIDRAISTVVDDKRRVDTSRHAVDQLAKPDALRWKAASEAGRIIELVVAEAQGVCLSVKMMAGIEVGPDDESDIPDLPPGGLAQLEQLLTDLKQYTTQHFYALLKKDI